MEEFDRQSALVLATLNARLKDIEGKSYKGLLSAGFMIERESNLNVPREYGNLVGSSYTRKSENGDLSVEVGYTASYAVYVHENMEMKLAGKPRPSGLGVYWGPHGSTKFLQNAILKLSDTIVETIAKYAKVS